MNKFSNKRKESFLDSIPTESLDNKTNDIVCRCKFNFSYFDNSQGVGQDFKDWTQEELAKLLDKLKNYCKFSLEHWKNEKIGSGKHRNGILVEYGSFPVKTDFKFPLHIPHQVIWGRFRLEQATRLVGFTIPKQYEDLFCNNKKLKYRFDCNTFYVVFLDKNHRFWKSSNK
ncbi:MAG: hypothetical protein BKP49_02425 [Treponema sp. CETP13]|nr:MAG: hypothetical protein BKP49_02425 [Treponema sp. CETP13]